MLISIRGYYENGQIVLSEPAPVTGKTDVLITFLIEEKAKRTGKRIPGGLKGKVELPDDFDEMKDYM
jgi:hypothetical protein